jgi:predicted ArsR family transcriptional regulator
LALYRALHVSFWTDTKIAVDFTPRERYFYLYLLTNPHTSISGCYEIGIKQISTEMGISKKEVERLLQRLEEEHKVIEYDRETRELYILNWHTYNWNRSPNCRKAIEAHLKDIKNTSFSERIKELLRGLEAAPRAPVTDTDDDKPKLIDYLRMKKYVEQGGLKVDEE